MRGLSILSPLFLLAPLGLLPGCPGDGPSGTDAGPTVHTDGCTKSCGGKQCGDDGCGGTCGTCQSTQYCDASSNSCVDTCTRQCSGKQCGPDNCGGTCGTCTGTNEVCTAGLCTVCLPNCLGKSCGSNGCGGQCGTCTAGTCNTTTGVCDGCARQCSGKSCGNDGCGGQCGTCTTGTCDASGQCPGCIRQCTNKLCGPDGCGGACGDCATGTVCGVDGSCMTPDPLSACAPPTAQYTGTFTPEMYCDSKAKVLCDRMARCCLLGTNQYATCVTYYTRDCAAADLMARVAAGVTKIDAAKGKICLDGEAARKTCDSFFILPDCDDNVVFPFNNRAKGASCFSGTDCNFARCDRTPGTCGATGHGGTCQDYLAVGVVCNGSNLYCNPTSQNGGPLYCNQPSGSPTGMCVAKKLTGQPCNQFFECKSSDFCTGDGSTSGVCKTKIAAGATCAFRDQCVSGTRCAGKCIPPYTGVPGDKCHSPDDGLFLSGQECDWHSSFCKGATVLDFGTCTAFTALGAACTDHTECSPLAACLGNPPVCSARGDLGASCASVRECKYGLSCRGGLCAPLGQDNDPCVSDTDCVKYGHCDPVNRKCIVAGMSNGEACSSTPQCTTGFCSSSNTCATYFADGLTCNGTTKDWDDACSSGDCEKADDTSWLCRPTCQWP